VVRPVHHVQNSHLLGHSPPASQTKKKSRKRRGQDGNTDRYTVVTRTERRRGRKRTGKDGNTDKYTILTGTKEEKHVKGQEKMEKHRQEYSSNRKWKKKRT
jgi:hypothetical protein